MGQEQTKEKAAAAPATEPVATAPTPAATPPPPVGLASTLPSSSADAEEDSGQPLSTGSDPEWTASIPIMADAAKRWNQGGGSLALIQMLRCIASRPAHPSMHAV